MFGEVEQIIHRRFQKFRLYGLALYDILQQATDVLGKNLLITMRSLDPMILRKNSEHFARYLRGIFDKKESI